MPTVFGSLPVGARFTYVLYGVECRGYKVLPFPLLSLHRNSFHYVNAVLKPTLRSPLTANFECMAVLEESAVVNREIVSQAA